MSEVGSLPVQCNDVEHVSERLENDRVIKRTPIERSTSLGDLVNADVYLKIEHLQWTGSFKTRDTYDKIRQDTSRGIGEFVAASTGNHMQDVILAAAEYGADSTVMMPENAPRTKIDMTHDYGAEVELVDEDFQKTMTYAQSLAEESSAEFIHAYDDCDIVARQGTLGVEIYCDLPKTNTVVIPIGDGGLISGIATAIKHRDSEIRVVDMQAEGAETVHESLDRGTPVMLDDTDTITGGIVTGGISELTLRAIEEHVDKVITVSDGEIAGAILLLLECAKQVTKGTGTTSVATVLSDNLDVEDETVIPLLCGGSLGMTMLQTVLVRAFTGRRQTLHLRVRVRDEPGEMARLSRLTADRDANIHDVRHTHAIDTLDVDEAHLLFRIETKGAEHAAAIVDTIKDAGYAVDDVSGPS